MFSNFSGGPQPSDVQLLGGLWDVWSEDPAGELTMMLRSETRRMTLAALSILNNSAGGLLDGEERAC